MLRRRPLSGKRSLAGDRPHVPRTGLPKSERVDAGRHKGECGGHGFESASLIADPAMGQGRIVPRTLG